MGEAPRDIGTGSLLRTVTEQVARDPSAWTPEVARQVGGHFEALSAEWHLHHDPDRIAPLADALDRGGPDGGPVAGGDVVELGAGSGAGTRLLAERFGRVVAVDLSAGMLARLQVPGAARLLADASRLPLAAGSVGTLVCVNMLLFPQEVDRVLGRAGSLVWVNTIGDCTPIHLPADAVAAALGPGFEVVASRASWGTWAVARRR